MSLQHLGGFCLIHDSSPSTSILYITITGYYILSLQKLGSSSGIKGCSSYFLLLWKMRLVFSLSQRILLHLDMGMISRTLHLSLSPLFFNSPCVVFFGRSKLFFSKCCMFTTVFFGLSIRHPRLMVYILQRYTSTRRLVNKKLNLCQCVSASHLPFLYSFLPSPFLTCCAILPTSFGGKGL